SGSLSMVAQVHAKDLQENEPQSEKGCNLHSWSKSDKWKGCCYTPDHQNANCMWKKPKELTNYKGNGFEIASINTKEMTAGEAFETWRKSTQHRNVILNRKTWKDTEWNAIGVGIFENYATVWFGKKKDKRETKLCSEK
ncbi:MAG: hypothetical protein ABEH43_09365, partial [Flavobacteriales bacterium]